MMNAKKYFKQSALAAILITACAFWFTACQKEEIAGTNTASTSNSQMKVHPTGTVQRSFDDLLAAQQTGNGIEWWSSSPNVLAWGAAIGAFNGAQITSNNKAVPVWVIADYAGFWSSVLKDATGNDLGTTVTGHVTETTLSDGSAEITAEFHTTNSIMWASLIEDIDFSGYCTTGLSVPSAQMIYGYTMSDLIADPSLQPATCSINFKVSYIESAPGQAFFNITDPGQCTQPVPYTFTRFTVITNGSGILHPASGLVTEDTEVNSNMQQVSMDLASCNACQEGSATSDAFPVEKITFSH